MKIKVLHTVKMEEIPSGSGIIKGANGYYIIGDDSPYLFALNNDFRLNSKTLLLEDYRLFDGRIVKSQKPDFEALERIQPEEVIIFGSGSKSPQRDVFIRVLLKDSTIIERYDISGFYEELKKSAAFKNSELNIEATAIHNDELFLFNRRKNLIIQCNYTSFLNYINGNGSFPPLQFISINLPEINGVEAGFSGATALKEHSKIIFTASVEDTDNAYDDGEILGSFIGIMDIKENSVSGSFDFCEILHKSVKLKVESVCIEKEISAESAEILLITDDDKGNSILLKSLLTW